MSFLGHLHDVLKIVVKVASPVSDVLTVVDPPAGIALKAIVAAIVTAEGLFPDGEGDLKNKLAVAIVKRDVPNITFDDAQLASFVSQIVTALNAQKK